MNPFSFDWDHPLPDNERELMLTKMASAVRKRGLQTPAVWFLEIHKPLAPLGGQFAVMFSPFLGTLFEGGAYDLQKYTALLRQPANIDRLIQMIDEPKQKNTPELEGNSVQ